MDTPQTIGAHVTYNGSAQTVNSGADVLLIFDTEDRDDDAMVDLGTQAGRITVTVEGLYAIAGYAAIAANGSNPEVLVKIKLNGSTVIAQCTASFDCRCSTLRRL